MNEQEETIELMDDIEVVGPGEMLREARAALGFSQEQVAQRLNFRISLVNEIENDQFDKSIAETFNRGYLRNYAKLVAVAEDDIIASYENLNIAELQCAEMQSFSRETAKQAENALLMWVSYLIVGLLFSATIVWWMQNSDADEQSEPIEGYQVLSPAEVASKAVQNPNSSENDTLINESIDKSVDERMDKKLANAKTNNIDASATVNLARISKENNLNSPEASSESNNTTVTDENDTSTSTEQVIVDAQFTFLGDCWVNIHDATGERVAWGIKKSGYVMNISGIAPFSVILGKPELVKINFANENIDTARFARGNIAKFSLPMID